MEQVEYTDGIKAGIEERKQRGITIAALAKIDKDADGYWIVPSVTNSRPDHAKGTHHAKGTPGN